MKKTLLISTLIVVAFWWFWPTEEQVILDTNANVVTFDEGLDLNALVESSQKKRLKKAEDVLKVEVTERQEDAIEKQKAFSYLEVYQQLQLAQSCNKIFSELMYDENIDFDQWLIGVMRDIKGDKLYQPKNSQFELFHQHIVECTDLKDHVLGLSHQVSIKSAKPTDNNNSIIIDELEEQLSKTKAQTDKEKDIAKSLVLIENWKSSLGRLIDVSKGEDSLSAEEMLGLVNQIKALQKSRQAPSAINSSEVRLEISSQISAIHERIIEQKQVDEAVRSSVLAEFHAKSSQLFDSLYSSEPEVFIEINQALNLASWPLFMTYEKNSLIHKSKIAELVPEYVYPMDITRNLMGGIDAEWLKLNGDHIDQMIYCNLGGDCSADSLLIRRLCLPFNGYRVQPEACGSGVETFIRRELSPNQLQDIRYVVDWLEAQYGS